MSKVFEVHMLNALYPQKLELPATDYELLDVLDRLGDGEDAASQCSVDCLKFGYLGRYVNGVSLYELNELAYRLEGMNDLYQTAFRGVVELESSIPNAGRLIDLAENVYNIPIAQNIGTDEQLGRFLVNNELCLADEEISDNVLEYLDYARIGREHRLRENGIIINGVYIERGGEIPSVQRQFAPPERPKHTVLLDVESVARHILLDLPASADDIDRALELLGADQRDDITLKCVDCAAPALTRLIDAAQDMDMINRLAVSLNSMDRKQLVKFKAVADAVKPINIEQAVWLAGHMDDYILDRKLHDPVDVAEDVLKVSVGIAERELLLPFLDRKGFGEAVLKQQNGALSPYGYVQRADGEPLHIIGMTEPQSIDHRANGMELSM